MSARKAALARALQSEVDRIEEHNREIRQRENAIPVQARGPLTVDQFSALSPIPNLDRAIEEAERRLAAAQDSERPVARRVFDPFVLPRIDLAALRNLLAKDLPNLDGEALRRAQEHMALLGKGGEAWVGQGLQYSNHLIEGGHNECPFCAQDLAASPVLDHYRGFFSEGYDALRQEIIAASREFRTSHAGDVPAAFERSVRVLIATEN